MEARIEDAREGRLENDAVGSADPAGRHTTTSEAEIDPEREAASGAGKEPAGRARTGARGWPKRKPRERDYAECVAPARPDGSCSEWSTADLLRYLELWWDVRFAGEVMVQTAGHHPAQISGRLKDLERRGAARSKVWDAVDHLFRNWGPKLRKALGWKDKRPNSALLAHGFFFARVMQEADGGALANDPRVTHDSWDEEAARRQAENADERGW